MASIGILGAGTWGIALAYMLTKNGHDVTVWSALPEEIDSLSATRRHKNLPGMEIPSKGGRDKAPFTKWGAVNSACFPGKWRSGANAEFSLPLK